MNESYAVVTDAHGNWEATEVVGAAIAEEGITTVLNLGDNVGYNADSPKVLDYWQKWSSHIILGNHDVAAYKGGVNFNRVAKEIAEWTGNQLGEERLKYLQSLPRYLDLGHVFLSHGSTRREGKYQEPQNWTDEYVTPTDALGEKYPGIFDSVQRIGFVGHTHQPCAMTEDSCVLGNKDGVTVSLTSQKLLVVVPSVGQPRDGNNQTGFVIVRGDTLTFRRLTYNWEETARKVRAIEDLSESARDMTARRLELGK